MSFSLLPVKNFSNVCMRMRQRDLGIYHHSKTHLVRANVFIDKVLPKDVVKTLCRMGGVQFPRIAD